MPQFTYNFSHPMALRIANLLTSDIEGIAKQLGLGNIPQNLPFPAKARKAEWVWQEADRAQSYRDSGTLDKLAALMPALEARAAQRIRHPIPGKPMSTFIQGNPTTEDNVNISAPVKLDDIRPVSMPMPKDEPKPDPKPEGDQIQQIAAMLARLMNKQALDEPRVRIIAAEEASKLAQLPRRVEVVTRDAPQPKDMGVQHKQFEKLLNLCSIRGGDGYGYPILLPGPAGSGKTRAAMAVAEALGRPYYHVGAVDTEYKVLGYRDANGNRVETGCSKAYGVPSVLLMDELDGGSAQALVALCMMLENGECDFAGETIKRHSDNIIIATANTWGNGATHDYVGRNKLDKATTDRFIMLGWDYDEGFERALANNDAWVDKVQKVRKAIFTSSDVKHVVSPRASIRGAAMLAAGFTAEECLNMLVFRGLSDEQIRRVRQLAGV